MKDGSSAALCDCTWRRFAQRYSQEQLQAFIQTNNNGPINQVLAECREALRLAF
jgi:hypothetical protein